MAVAPGRIGRPYRAVVPELVEIEIYRRHAAETVLGRTIAGVDAPDSWYLKRGTTAAALDAVLVGRPIREVGRIGKLLLLDLASVGRAPAAAAAAAASASYRPTACDDTVVTLGLRFGMTGRLVVDDGASIDELLYSTSRADPAYERFALRFHDGGTLAIVDPRRLGGVELEPDVSRLGPDALTIDAAALAAALAGSEAPLKARLLDQARIAGIGNLIADETLWRAGVDPTRPARSLDHAEVVSLARRIRSTVRMLLTRGGSHLGDLQDERHRDGRCPRDGTLLRREQVGGRTTYWCPEHQR